MAALASAPADLAIGNDAPWRDLVVVERDCLSAVMVPSVSTRGGGLFYLPSLSASYTTPAADGGSDVIFFATLYNTPF